MNSLKTKICSKCEKEKSLDEFYKDKYCPDGYDYRCKSCSKKRYKKYYNENREKIIKSKIEWYKINGYPKKKYNKDYRKNDNKKRPWKYTLERIKKRCNNKNNPDYKYYGNRGIECRITAHELKELWFRDNAYEMKKPSIDRIDNDGHYEIGNCRYIEQIENSKKIRYDRKNGHVIQFDLNGNFIKEWYSIREAAFENGFDKSSIARCINGKQKTSYKYLWRYKNET